MAQNCLITGTLYDADGMPNARGGIAIRQLKDENGIIPFVLDVTADDDGYLSFTAPAGVCLGIIWRGANNHSRLIWIAIPPADTADWNDLRAMREWPQTSREYVTEGAVKNVINIALTEIVPAAVEEAVEEAFTSRAALLPDTTDELPEGANNLYFTGGRVRAVALTGLSLVTSAAISAADSLLTALGKLQAQITALAATLDSQASTISSHTTTLAGQATNATAMNGHIGNKTNPHEVTKAQIGLANVLNFALTPQTVTAFTGQYTADQESTPYSGVSTLAQLTSMPCLSAADGNALRVAYENLRAAFEAQRNDYITLRNAVLYQSGIIKTS